MIELKHKKLNVWTVSMGLTSNVYTVISKFPKSELYGLTPQLRRAAVSVPSNIAEGSARSSAKERCRFYEISRSSPVEIDTQMEIALRLDYVHPSDIERMKDQTNHAL